MSDVELRAKCLEMAVQLKVPYWNVLKQAKEFYEWAAK